VAPPLNVVLINSKINSSFNDEHRRLIAKFSPVCYAYNYHLVLVNFKIETSPIDFAKEMAPSTSIGKSGETLIELAKKGMIKIKNLPIPENLGKIVICTSKPDESKIQNHRIISKLLKKEKIALIFGCDENRNKNIRRLIEKADYHLDISGNKIRLSLDTEIGAVTSIIRNSK
jgi:hypothetical protein|tara:strand:+ start:736 stop:1254 length:519 start_codon:yes stop_codon:yes gene_type:complete